MPMIPWKNPEEPRRIVPLPDVTLPPPILPPPKVNEKDVMAALKVAIKAKLDSIDMYPIVHQIVKDLLVEIVPRLDFKGRNIHEYVADMVKERVETLLIQGSR